MPTMLLKRPLDAVLASSIPPGDHGGTPKDAPEESEEPQDDESEEQPS